MVLVVDITKVASAAAVECVRQHVGLDRVAMLINGYISALDNGINLASVMDIAGIVEPTSGGRFRTGAVTFANGGISTNPGSIPEQMVRLFMHVDNAEPFEFVRAFELIHPFSDGNGRVGWIIYNVLNGTMDSPVPLPDFNF